MNLQKVNTSHNWKNIIAIFFAFSVFISACTIQTSIKSFLKFETGTKKASSKQASKIYKVSSSDLKCKFCKESEKVVKSSQDFSIADAQELIAFTFIVLCGAFLLVKAPKHPFYNTSKIRGTLPIFLQYRKLII